MDSVIRIGTKITYIRYADDFVIGVIGNKARAEEIKEKVSIFLKEKLKIELNMEKTKITNIRQDSINFLSYTLTATDKKYYSSKLITNYMKREQRAAHGKIKLYIPLYELMLKLEKKKFVKEEKGVYYGPWINLDVYEIIKRYNYILRGLYNYYILANNINRISYIAYLLIYSAAHTIAAKNKTSIYKVMEKYGKKLQIKHTTNKTIDLDISKYPKKILYKDTRDPLNITNWEIRTTSSFDKPCKICGTTSNIEMHHIKHLKDLNPKLSTIDALMAKINRKQIPVCQNCHDKIHSGKYYGTSLKKL